MPDDEAPKTPGTIGGADADPNAPGTAVLGIPMELTGAKDAQLGELARATMEASAELRGPTAGATESAQGATDRWGRTFDPKLHAATLDGKPALRGGKTLILLPGAPRGDKATPAKARIATATGIQLTETAKPGAETSPAAVAAPQVQPPAAAPVGGLSPEQLRAKARTGGKLLARGWRMIGRFLNPDAAPFTSEEATDIPQTGEDWVYNNGINLPVGDLTLHVVAGTEYLVRVAATDKGRSRLADAIAWAKVTFKGEAPVVQHKSPTPQQPAPTPAPVAKVVPTNQPVSQLKSTGTGSTFGV